MNLCLSKYKNGKYGIFQVGIMILKLKINLMLILGNIFPLGDGQHGMIDMKNMKKIVKNFEMEKK